MCVPYLGHARPLLDEASELHLRGWNITFVTTTRLRFLAKQYEQSNLHIHFIDEPENLRRVEGDVFERASLETAFEIGSTAILRHTYESYWELFYSGLFAAHRDGQFGPHPPSVVVADAVK